MGTIYKTINSKKHFLTVLSTTTLVIFSNISSRGKQTNLSRKIRKNISPLRLPLLTTYLHTKLCENTDMLQVTDLF